MAKMTKKEISSYLKEFEAVTGLRVVDGCSYVLSSNNGDLKVTFRLADDLPAVFTCLITQKSDFDLFREFEPLGYNPNSGKQNYYNDAIYDFLQQHVVSFDIKKSDTAITAKIAQSMFDKTGVNKMYDLHLFKGGEDLDSSICIDYMEARLTAINFKATLIS